MICLRKFIFPCFLVLAFSIQGYPVWGQNISTNAKCSASSQSQDVTPQTAMPSENNACQTGPDSPAPASTQPGTSLIEDTIRTTHRIRGLELHVFLKAEASSNFHSGLTWDGTDFRDLLETSASLDLQKAVGWKGGRFLFSFHSYAGSNASDAIVGDVQGFSNIDDHPSNEIYELWYEQTLDQGKVRIKLGQIDTNTEFAYVENGTEFLNSSMGYSPTILDFHSYPDPRRGAIVALKPRDFLYISLGAFQCLPGGVMGLGEAGTRWKIFKRVLPGRVAFGYWIHFHDMEGFQGRSAYGVRGHYLIAEQTLWRKNAESPDDPRGIAAFVQWGDASPLFNGIAQHVGAGFQWTGLFYKRPGDVTGLGITQVALGQGVEQDLTVGRERAYEVFHKVRVRSWLSFTPDLQVIDHPSGSVARTKVCVGTLRMVVSY